MTKRPWIVFVLLLVCTLVQTSSMYADYIGPKTKLFVRYNTPENVAVELHYNESIGRITLQVKLEGSTWAIRDSGLELLKDEVLRLTSANGPVRLGKSGYRFIFRGNHPMWRPYSSSRPGAVVYMCLVFARSGHYTGDKTIYAHGDAIVVGYDGYRLWTP